MLQKPIYFSKFLVTDQVFFQSKYCFAVVNLKPIMPGHILVVPYNTNHIELSNLSVEETTDFFNTVQLLQQFIRKEFSCDAINVAIQDGPEAGQSVPHVHAHIIPRYRASNIGDKIYEEIDLWNWEKRRSNYLTGGAREGRKQKEVNDSIIDNVQERALKPDDQRKERTAEMMKQEAEVLKKHLDQFLRDKPELQEFLYKK